MNRLRAVRVAGVLAMIGGVELGLGLMPFSARAQAPGGAPSAPTVAAVRPPAVPRPNPPGTAPARRPVYSRRIPPDATVGGIYRDWTADRPIPLSKPWLKAMR
jgi:hypothetical protein